MSIFTVIHSESEAAALTGWSALLAKGNKTDLCLCFTTPFITGSAASGTEQEKHFEDVLAQPKPPDGRLGLLHKALIEHEFTGKVKLIRLVCAKPKAKIIDFLQEQKTELLIVGKHQTGQTRGSDQNELARELFAEAPCATMILRPNGAPGILPKKCLVPTAGGPHSIVALKYAAGMANAGMATCTPLYVSRAVSNEGKGLGLKIIKRALKKAGASDSPEITPKTVVARGLEQGIAKAAGEEYDLTILGHSNPKALKRSLFGTVPEHMFRESGSSVAVIRNARPIHRHLSGMLNGFIEERIPQLDRNERIDLFERLQSGATWNFDFIFLMCMATAIAALGLAQNSTAVVIGAMLVAPLMLPILAAGLGLVQGNWPMMRSSMRSIGLGFVVSLAIGLLTGWVSGLERLNDELLGRGAPNMLDLGIALFSGIAAAFCLGRPNLSAALPGVAIAAALVPPIATAGISLALGYWSNAHGAALLFATNVVTIIVGAALVFFAVGVRHHEKKREAFWQLLAVFGVVILGLILLLLR